VDEEAYAPNNPRDMKAVFGSDTCRPGVKSGESTLREAVAFLLDHEGFAGVPATALVDLKHESMPSLSLDSSMATSEDVFGRIQKIFLNATKTPSTVRLDLYKNSCRAQALSKTTVLICSKTRRSTRSGS